MTVFAKLRALGPAFAVDAHAAEAVPVAPWRPFGELLAEPAWEARTDAVRRALAGMAGRPAEDVEVRVALATAHLGVVARVLAPAFALAVLGTALPAAGDLWWQPVLGGPPPLSFPATLTRLPAGDAADAFTDRIVNGLVVGLTEAAARVCRIAPAILRDNGASAINSSAGMLAAARPELGDRAVRFADELLRQRPWRLAAPSVGAGFRRGSCCLIYRVGPGPPRAVCGDCVLTGR